MNERRPERRAGDLLVVVVMKMKKEKKNQTVSETVVQPGGST